jgi:hypothetical protein
MGEWDRILTGIGKPGYPNPGAVACSGILGKEMRVAAEGGQERVFKAFGGSIRPILSSHLWELVKRGSARAEPSFVPRCPSARMSPTGLSLSGLHACIARFRFTRSRGPA